MSNGELATTLERVAEGDRVAFRSLYQAVGPKLFSICKRLMRDQDAAQDALQDVMVRIWEKSPLFDRAKGDAMAWMVALARSVIFNRLAKRPAPALSLSDDTKAQQQTDVKDHQAKIIAAAANRLREQEKGSGVKAPGHRAIAIRTIRLLKNAGNWHRYCHLRSLMYQRLQDIGTNAYRKGNKKFVWCVGPPTARSCQA